MKAALTSEEIEGTVRSWPPKREGARRTEATEPQVKRTNSVTSEPGDSSDSGKSDSSDSGKVNQDSLRTEVFFRVAQKLFEGC